MSPPPHLEPDPRLDLVLERVVDVPPELVWEAWTQPEHLKEWFTPAPWSTVECEIDLRPGGMFRTVMRSPEGREVDGGAGCYLEVVENERLVWTTALEPGYRPARRSGGADAADLVFTAVITMEPHGTGTKYTAIAMHPDEAGRDAHDRMGFHEGWGKALDQLVAHAKTMT
ncbi:MAG: SRPBCC family protein [Gemmatimonadota bacterium]